MLKKLLLTSLMCLPMVAHAKNEHRLPPPSPRTIFPISPTPDYVAPQGSKFFTVQETNEIKDNGLYFWIDLPDKNNDFFLTQLTKYLKNPKTENLFTLLGMKRQTVYSHQCPIDEWRTKKYPDYLWVAPPFFCSTKYQTYLEYQKYMDSYYIYNKDRTNQSSYHQLFYHDTPYLIPENHDIKENNHDINFFVSSLPFGYNKAFDNINFNTTKYCISQKDLMKNIKLEFPDATQYYFDIFLDKEKTKKLQIFNSNNCISSLHYIDWN